MSDESYSNPEVYLANRGYVMPEDGRIVKHLESDDLVMMNADFNMVDAFVKALAYKLVEKGGLSDDEKWFVEMIDLHIDLIKDRVYPMFTSGQVERKRIN